MLYYSVLISRLVNNGVNQKHAKGGIQMKAKTYTYMMLALLAIIMLTGALQAIGV